MLDFKSLERFSKRLSRGFHPTVNVKVNRTEVQLLMMLQKDKDMPFKHYGSRLHMEKSSFSYIVDLLVLKDLVVKVEDEADKRRKTLELTDKGVELVNELEQQHKTYIDEKLSVFSEEEREELKNAVSVIHELGKKLKGNDKGDHMRRRHHDGPHRPHKERNHRPRRFEHPEEE